MKPFFRYLFAFPRLFPLGIQLVVFSVIGYFWCTPNLILWPITFIAVTLVTEYGRFSVAREPRNRELSIGEFTETRVPGLQFWGVLGLFSVGLGVRLVYQVPATLYIFWMMSFCSAIIFCYYVGAYQGIKYGVRGLQSGE